MRRTFDPFDAERLRKRRADAEPVGEGEGGRVSFSMAGICASSSAGRDTRIAPLLPTKRYFNSSESSRILVTGFSVCFTIAAKAGTLMRLLTNPANRPRGSEIARVKTSAGELLPSKGETTS